MSKIPTTDTGTINDMYIRQRILDITATEIIDWLGLSPDDVLNAICDEDMATTITDTDDTDMAVETLVNECPDEVAEALKDTYRDDLYDYISEICPPTE